MLLKELKQLTESYIPQGIRDYMENKGYEYLGKGADQMAFKAPDGSILKVFGHDGSGGKSEAHYMFDEWHDFCQRHKHSHLVPQFLEYAPFRHQGQYYLQIKMERLFDLPDDLENAFWTISDVAAGESLEEFTKLLSGQRLSNKIDYDIKPQALQLFMGAVDNVEEFWHIVQELNVIARAHNWDLDLHGGNAMLDNEGMLVIVDPWFAEGGGYYNSDERW